MIRLSYNDGDEYASVSSYVFTSQMLVGAIEEARECREQEYKDRFGICKPCRQCEAGQELSKVGADLCWLFIIACWRLNVLTLNGFKQLKSQLLCFFFLGGWGGGPVKALYEKQRLVVGQWKSLAGKCWLCLVWGNLFTSLFRR